MNAITLTVGTRLKFKLGGNIVTGTYSRPSENAEYGIFNYDDREFTRSYARVKNLNPDWTPSTANHSPVISAAEVLPTATSTATPLVPKPVNGVFSVNTRFDYIERMVDMIVRDQEKSMVVCGSGGLGKSYTIFDRLKSNDLGSADFDKISGHMTPRALYRRMHDSNGKILVFDDCDSILTSETTVNLLKPALDTYGDRTVHWESEMGGRDNNLPHRFDFSGRVIVISNFSLIDIPQALISRALYVDVTMTPDEKITRITALASKLCPQLTGVELNECLSLLSDYRYKISDLNLRTMLKVASIRRANPGCWLGMAKYQITAQIGKVRR